MDQDTIFFLSLILCYIMGYIAGRLYKKHEKNIEEKQQIQDYSLSNFGILTISRRFNKNGTHKQRKSK